MLQYYVLLTNLKLKDGASSFMDDITGSGSRVLHRGFNFTSSLLCQPFGEG
jgi:hypothetical protein